MKIYIAGAFEAQQRLRNIRDRVVTIGHTVTSTWHDQLKEDGVKSNWPILGKKDKAEVLLCEFLFLDTLDKTDRKGYGAREFELGYAEGMGKFVVRVGPIRHIFHTQPDWAFFSWVEALEWLYRQKFGTVTHT